MGTRADFYIGNGADAKWIGSIGWDGYPEGIDNAVLSAKTVETFREALAHFFAGRDDVSSPDHGWPWPWDNSQKTDFAYCFIDGKVEAYDFGHGPFDPLLEYTSEEENIRFSSPKAIFPDMTSTKNVTLGKRSGLIRISGRSMKLWVLIV